jgi:hypothetical protein
MRPFAALNYFDVLVWYRWELPIVVPDVDLCKTYMETQPLWILRCTPLHTRFLLICMHVWMSHKFAIQLYFQGSHSELRSDGQAWPSFIGNCAPKQKYCSSVACTNDPHAPKHRLL